MTNAAEEAISIVFDVMRRRAQGEVIDDDEVLKQHPHLSAELLEQLRRGNRIAAAALESSKLTYRESGDASPNGPLSSPPAAATPLASADDLRTTLEPSPGLADTSPLAPQDLTESKNEPDQGAVQRLFRPRLRPPLAALKVMFDDQQAYEFRMLYDESTTLGRSEGTISIPHDSRVSNPHAVIERRVTVDGCEWRLSDLNSEKGTFVRASSATLKHDDEVFLGQECYKFLLQGDEAMLVLMDVEDVAEAKWMIKIPKSGFMLGRDTPGAMPQMRDDPCLAGKHAFVSLDSTGRWVIQNTHTVNGVWYRIRRPIRLLNGACIQMGEQRFVFCRVD